MITKCTNLAAAVARPAFKVLLAHRAATKLDNTVLPDEVGAQMRTDRFSSMYLSALQIITVSHTNQSINN